jgi:hypothetical protein
MPGANVRRRGMGSPEPRTKAVRGLTAGRLLQEPAALRPVGFHGPDSRKTVGQLLCQTGLPRRARQRSAYTRVISSFVIGDGWSALVNCT